MPHLAFLGNAAGYHLGRWLPALARTGLDVTLLSFLPPESDLPGVRFHRLDPPVSRPGRVRYLDFLLGARSVRRALDALSPDVLLASYATNYGFTGARVGFRPLILQTWTADVTLYPFEGWKRLFFRPLVAWTLGRADVVTTDGAGLAEEVRRRFPGVAERVVAIRWGVPVDERPPDRAAARARWGIPPEAPLVTSPRGVGPHYRAEVLLPALRALLDHAPEAHGLVLTLGHERAPAVQTHLDALADHPRARVVDRFLNRTEMQDVWAMTDVLVSATLHDGVSESILEGMLGGALPVVSDNPSNRSFLPEDERAIYVHGRDAEAWFSVLSDVLGRLPDLRARMVEPNRRWVIEHASVDASAERLAAVVRRLAAG